MPAEHVEGDHRVLTVFYPDGQPIEREQGYRDSSGQFVRHGTWETWYPDGKRECYASLEHGVHHGRRFNWDWNGNLSAIEKFNHNELIEYESQNLEAHPEYAEAQRLSGIGSDHRTDGPETRGKVISDGIASPVRQRAAPRSRPSRLSSTRPATARPTPRIAPRSIAPRIPRASSPRERQRSPCTAW